MLRSPVEMFFQWGYDNQVLTEIRAEMQRSTRRTQSMKFTSVWRRRYKKWVWQGNLPSEQSYSLIFKTVLMLSEHHTCQCISLSCRMSTYIPEFANWMFIETSEAWMRAEVSASISRPFKECISCVLMTLLARYLCLWIMNSAYMRSCSLNLWVAFQWCYYKCRILLGHMMFYWE